MQMMKCGLALWIVGIQAACTAADSADDAASSSSTAVGTLQVEAIDKVVGVADPVAAYATTDTSASAVATTSFNQLIISGLQLTATKGVSLGDTASTINAAFNTAGGSKAFCETVNNGMKFFKESSSPDFNLCILKKATSGLLIKNSGSQTWDFKGTSTSFGAFTFRIKFALEADDDGGLKTFETFNCSALGSSGTLKQSSYVSQSITDGALSIHARVQSEQSGSTVKIRTDVTGAVNDEGRPVGLKTIDYAESQGNRSVHTKVTQSAANIQAIGYENVSNRVTQYLSFVELLDTNAETGQYYVTKIAYGDGAAITRITETNGTASNNTSSWDGDTLVLDANELRRAKVNNRQAEFLSATGDSLDLSFAEAETYDCAGTADETIAIEASDVMSCMEPFDIDQNGSSLCSSLSY